jgi:hypothetical protein
MLVITAKRPLKKGFYGVGHISHPIRYIAHCSVNFPSLIVRNAAPVINAHLNLFCVMVKHPILRISTYLNRDNIVYGR